MKIEAGKRYVLRDGTISGRLEKVENAWFKWVRDPESGLMYAPNDPEFGHLVTAGEEEHPNDLMKEYEE